MSESNDVILSLVVKPIEALLDFRDFLAKLRDRHAAAWKNLFRSLKPTPEEVAQDQQDDAQRALIVHLNQDVAQYNAKTWWDEYNQARAYNVN